eukprot:3435127-Amphidinium_carterae.1
MKDAHKNDEMARLPDLEKDCRLPSDLSGRPVLPGAAVVWQIMDMATVALPGVGLRHPSHPVAWSVKSSHYWHTRRLGCARRTVIRKEVLSA